MSKGWYDNFLIKNMRLRGCLLAQVFRNSEKGDEGDYMKRYPKKVMNDNAKTLTKAVNYYSMCRGDSLCKNKGG